LDFFISESINTLTPHAKELAKDATFGINNAGMDLFAVLAEANRTGVPLAYSFVEVFENNGKSQRCVVLGAIGSNGDNLVYDSESDEDIEASANSEESGSDDS
jgi:hypothetical protein